MKHAAAATLASLTFGLAACAPPPLPRIDLAAPAEPTGSIRPTRSATADRDLGVATSDSSSPVSTRPLVRSALDQPEPPPPPEPPAHVTPTIHIDGLASHPFGISSPIASTPQAPPPPPTAAAPLPTRSPPSRTVEVSPSIPQAAGVPQPDGPMLDRTMATPGLADRAAERDCLARAMFFEGRPDDHASLLAVGTLVANRAESRSGRWPNTLCGVVAQERQFSSNPLARSPDYKADPLALSVADEILQGIRYPGLEGVFNFVTQGYSPPPGSILTGTIGGNLLYRNR